jgi:hypothetical protein
MGYSGHSSNEISSPLADGHRVGARVGELEYPILITKKRKIYMRNKEWGWVGWVPPFPHLRGAHATHPPNVS